MRRILFALVLALAFSGSAEAKRAGHPASPEPDPNLFFDENVRVETAYRVLMAHLGPAGQASLRTSQRRWIQSRNRACGFETRNACALRLIVARNRALERTITRQTAWRHWPDRPLIKLDLIANSACRGLAQDAYGPICLRRDEVTRVLERRGWCWGPDSVLEQEAHWMRQGRLCKPYYGN